METEGPIDGEAPPPEPKLSVSPVLFSPVFWSPSAGFGFGFGANISNLRQPGDALLVEVSPATKRGQYGAWYQTRSPYGPGTSLFGGAFYEADGQYTYFGVGPGSSENNEVSLDRRLFEVEGRASYGLGESGRLRAQAWTRWQRHDIRRARNLASGARANLDARSESALLATLDGDPTALGVGGDLSYDTRSNVYNPISGVLLQAGSFQQIRTAGTFEGFNQRHASASVFLPISEETIVNVRAILVDSDAPEDTPVVLLPLLDSDIGPGMGRHRFTAPDYVFASIEARRPIFDLFGFVAMDGVATVAVFSAYDDVWKQFSPTVTAEKTVTDDGGRLPLRPAAALGLRFHSGFLESTLLNLTVHGSADGIGIATFGITTDLRAPRPLLRAR